MRCWKRLLNWLQWIFTATCEDCEEDEREVRLNRAFDDLDSAMQGLNDSIERSQHAK